MGYKLNENDIKEFLLENDLPIRKVLILDSDQDLIGILASFLSLYQIRVTKSIKAREALFKMRNQKFDLVVLDPANIESKIFFSGLTEFSSLRNTTKLILMSQNLDFIVPQPLFIPLRGVLAKPFSLASFWSLI